MTQTVPDIFDLCVLGCGPAGFAGAMRALDFGKHVCIIEGAEIGGAGIMRGAMASKTMWELAKDYAIADKQDRGYRAAGLTVDYDAVRRTVVQACKEKQQQMLSQIESFSPGRWNGPGSLTLKKGWGKLLSNEAVEICYPDGRREEARSRFFLIATGSKPRSLPNVEVDQQLIFNSDGILNLKKFPERLVIIGAGIIGCEYATIFANFKQSHVTLVDHSARVVPFEDDDVSDFVNTNLVASGVRVIHSAKLREIFKKPDHVEILLDFKEGRSEILEADAVLLSIGRSLDQSGVGLEDLGINIKDSCLIRTDEKCCINSNIYAAGDITHHPSLVNLAEMEGRYAVKHMFGKNHWPLNYDNMSKVMFFYPAVATVGLNEKGCRSKKIPYRVAYYSNVLCNRAIAMRATNGFIKIIVTDDEQQRILGMRAAGPEVSSTIMSIAHFMDQGKGVLDILKTVYPHPTITEGIEECLRMLLNKSIYKPYAFPDFMKIHRWHPDTGLVREK